ncbi:MAG TPA: mechanosensitive ion channel domain-containing protein [Gammaproteobacteria bacterium]|nr:mechanosensitive ion channel domain-containing protein [Gammaproteobacteria bacterium]
MNATEAVIAAISTYGLNVVGAIIILIVGYVAAGWAARLTSRAMSKSGKVDETIRHFTASLVRYGVIVFTVLAVLARFGVQTTSFIAVLGAAGLAIGLAFQGTLSNVAAGFMLLLFRPFRVGQFIDAAGVSGTVESITLFITRLNTPDNVHIIIPNSQLWGQAVKNFSHNDRRRVDIKVGIGYDDDIGKALQVLKDLASADERVHKEPEPMVITTGLGDNSVDLQIRMWCAASDYWGIYFDLTRKVKEALDGAGITIPYPQRTVHLEKAE